MTLPHDKPKKPAKRKRPARPEVFARSAGITAPRRDWEAVGLDVSINHAGAVKLDGVDGELLDFAFLTPLVGLAKSSRSFGTRIPAFKQADVERHQSEIDRLRWLREWFGRLADRLFPLDGVDYFVAIEDYALDAARGAHQMGEVGGALRLALFDFAARHPGRSINLRFWEPGSVKIFATGNGNAEKELVGECARAKWRTAPLFGDDDVDGDLADAHTLARMVWRECRVRLGRDALADLPDEERRIFLRTTKSEPVAVCDRPFASYHAPA